MTALNHLILMGSQLAARLRPTRDERGASMIEYALLASLIGIFAIVAVKFFGTQVSNSFSNSANQLPN
jgi:Flp pilus assembly pilin Flp